MCTDGRIILNEVICDMWNEFSPLGKEYNKELIQTMQCVFRFLVVYRSVKFTEQWPFFHTYVYLYLKRMNGKTLYFRCVCVRACACVVTEKYSAILCNSFYPHNL